MIVRISTGSAKNGLEPAIEVGCVCLNSLIGLLYACFVCDGSSTRRENRDELAK
jgi:hypothetical protein